jgi:hypothetical protein
MCVYCVVGVLWYYLKMHVSRIKITGSARIVSAVTSKTTKNFAPFLWAVFYLPRFSKFVCLVLLLSLVWKFLKAVLFVSTGQFSIWDAALTKISEH